jgi:hypothetical protein
MLNELKPLLIEAFGGDGVVRVEYVSAFPDQDDAWVRLGTATDAERDGLASSDLLVALRDVVRGVGFDPGLISGVTVQSEQTVARDYAGSWFYALR